MIIWTPDPLPATPAPVLIWLHPGAFVAASANLAAANGQRFAEETGTIVVAANYRLGAFGFLAHPALSNEDPAYPSSGNFGLLDQRAAFVVGARSHRRLRRRSRPRHDRRILGRCLERRAAPGFARQRRPLSPRHHPERTAHDPVAYSRRSRTAGRAIRRRTRLRRSGAGGHVHALPDARSGAERTPNRIGSGCSRDSGFSGVPSSTAWSFPISRARCSRAAPLPACR